MSGDPHKARDLKLLDAIDSFRRAPFSRTVWRATRKGRDPLQGSRSRSRWCNDTFDVLYTSLERDGAVAEIFSLLSSQPVFPSKIRPIVSRISVAVKKVLRLEDLSTLERLGVDTMRYRERVYQRTQEIADGAYFLGFQGLLAPSARWNCQSLVLFTDRISPEEIAVEHREDQPIDWEAWRSTHKR